MYYDSDSKIKTELIKAIEKVSYKCKNKQLVFMEVCGTHTWSIFKHGIKSVLPKNISLISGPGCPVCVTPSQYIDQAVELAQKPEVTICTFGDMIRVPGAEYSIEDICDMGVDIRVVYSPMDCLKIAKENPNKKVVFLAVGFETTAPVIALAIKQAERQGVKNFFILSGLKLLFPALKTLLSSGEIKIDGLICPGHVSAITGEKPYKFIPEDYRIPCVISGFEAVDILIGVYMLVLQFAQGRADVENAYKRAGTTKGNEEAVKVIKEAFETSDESWRGFGLIPASGLVLTEKYRHRDARIFFKLEKPNWEGDKNCCCGEVVKGLKKPPECPLFKKVCTPHTPMGACMVSQEGTCAAYYKYN